jgi:hypothetical protein
MDKDDSLETENMSLIEKTVELDDRISSAINLLSTYRHYVDVNRVSCAGWTTEFVWGVLNEIAIILGEDEDDD